MRKNPSARSHRIDTDARHDARTGKRASVVQAQRRLKRLGELGYVFGDGGWYHQSDVWRSNELFGGSGGREKVPRAVSKDLTEYVRSGTYTSNVPRGGALGEARTNPMPNRSMTSQQRARFTAGASAARRAYAQWTSRPGTPLPFSPGEDHWYDAGWDATWRRLSNGMGGKHPGYRETRANPRLAPGVSMPSMNDLSAVRRHSDAVIDRAARPVLRAIMQGSAHPTVALDRAGYPQRGGGVYDDILAPGGHPKFGVRQLAAAYDVARRQGANYVLTDALERARGQKPAKGYLAEEVARKRRVKVNPSGYQFYVCEVDDATRRIVRVVTGNEYREDAQEAKADQPRPPAGHSLRVYGKAKVEREIGIPRGMKGMGRQANPGLRARSAAADYSEVEARISAANKLANTYNSTLARALKAHGERGPWISAIAQEHFPESVKEKLRTTIHAFHAAQDAVNAAWRKVHPRTDFYHSSKASPFRARMVRAGSYGTGGARKANPQGSAAFPQGDASHRLTKALRAKLTAALAVYPEKRNGDHAVMRQALNWPGGLTTKKLLWLDRLASKYTKKTNPKAQTSAQRAATIVRWMRTPGASGRFANVTAGALRDRFGLDTHDAHAIAEKWLYGGRDDVAAFRAYVASQLGGGSTKKGNPSRIAWQPPTERVKKYGVDLVGYDDAGNRYEIESENVRGTKWHEVYLMPHAGSFGGGVREKLTSKGTLALAKAAAEQTAARMAR